MTKLLTTSLDEIRSHDPCESVLARAVAYWGNSHPGATPIPFIELVKSNTFRDICWLLGKRRVEIKIAVAAAKLCADSVQYERKNKYYAAAADDDAAYAAADAYTDAAAAYAADADDDAAAAAWSSHKQRKLNLSFLLQAIEEFQATTN